MDGTQYGKPKYELIMEDLMERINSKDFSYDQPICTEKQISEQYNVSRITAKRAITDLEAQGVLYRKRGVGSFVCRTPRGNSSSAPVSQEASRMVSLLMPFDFTKGGMFDTIESINRGLGQSGYFLSIHTTDSSQSKERATLKLLLDQNIAGLVFYPFRDKSNLNLLNQFILNNVPVVILDKTIDCPYIPSVISDNFEGGRLVTEHLLTLGHRRIAFLTTAPIEETSSVRNRFGGCLEALRAHSVPLSPQNLVYLPIGASASQIARDTGHPLYAVVQKLYAAGVTAIFTENDVVAAAVKACCTQLGIRVPDQMSVAGFDNSELAEAEDITTVNQDFVGIGQRVSETLLAWIQGNGQPARQVTMPVELIVRASTAAPRNM